MSELITVCLIPLSGENGYGRFAIVDPVDYGHIMQYKWAYHIPGYARTSIGPRSAPRRIYMHRMIHGTPNGYDTDHINGLRLDNRRCNLRTATRLQNMANRHAPWRTGSSRYRGVNWDASRERWLARITVDRVGRNLGRFDSEDDAARAYDEAAVLLWGLYANLNFPPE